VWGVDRPSAIDRMLRALGEYRVVGVRTTVPALQKLIAHPDFRAGRLSTALLERVLPGPSPRDERLAPVAVIAAVLAEHERARHTAAPVDTPSDGSAWRSGARLGWQRPVA
jgi:acetyl/propionyl-CoA carboxylase alpha subunit